MKKTKSMNSRDVPQGHIVIESDEIEEVKEYAYLEQMVNMRQDMDVKISQRIRSGWKAFAMIKDVLKVKLNKTCQSLQ